MDTQLQAIWADYRERGYSLLAVGVRALGVDLPLVCERGDELVLVVPGRDPLPEAEVEALNAGLREFLIGRRTSERFLRIDGAWIEGGRITITKEIAPVHVR